MHSFRPKRFGSVSNRKCDASIHVDMDREGSSKDGEVQALEFQVETQGVEETWEWDGSRWRRVS
jgi:hypothetical protein